MTVRGAARLLLAVLAACGGEAAPPLPPLPAPPKPSPVPTVKLIDPGRAPWRVLTYGTAAPVSYEFDFNKRDTGHAGETPVAHSLEGRIAVALGPRSSRGGPEAELRLMRSRHWERDFSASSQPPPSAESPPWSPTNAYVGLILISERGFFMTETPARGQTDPVSWHPDDADGDEILRSGILWTVPIPEEPVGVGAIWALTGELDVLQLRTAIGAVARLDRLGQGDASVHLLGVLDAGPQKSREAYGSEEFLGQDGTIEGDWTVEAARPIGQARWHLHGTTLVRDPSTPPNASAPPKVIRQTGDCEMERTIR